MLLEKGTVCAKALGRERPRWEEPSPPHLCCLAEIHPSLAFLLGTTITSLIWAGIVPGLAAHPVPGHCLCPLLSAESLIAQRISSCGGT